MNIKKRGDNTTVIATVLLSHHTWHVTPNYEYAQVWVESIQKEGLHGVLFHDSALADKEDFIAQGIDLIEVEDTTSVEPWIERYFIYRKMLEDNPWIQDVFFTDARDIWFYQDPIKFFRRYIDMGYFIAQEEWDAITPESEFMKRLNKIKMLGGNAMQIYNRHLQVSEGERPYCAGAFGGAYYKCLNLLKYITDAFQPRFDKPEWDMGIYNLALREGVVGDIMCFGSGYNALEGYQERIEIITEHKSRYKDSEGGYPSPLMHDIHKGNELLNQYRLQQIQN